MRVFGRAASLCFVFYALSGTVAGGTGGGLPGDPRFPIPPAPGEQQQPILPSQSASAQALQDCEKNLMKMTAIEVETCGDLAKRNHAPRLRHSLAIVYSLGFFGVAQDSVESDKWVRLAAEQGDALMQYNVGNKYRKGKGVEQDYVEALKWFRLAAEQGEAIAQSLLGLMYTNGEGVLQDYATAVKWYRLAAEQGNSAAQVSLASTYMVGLGVAQDYGAAAKWSRLAAEQGNSAAQNNLGAMYEAGLGVPQDYVMAYMWYNLASIDGNPYRRTNRDLILKKMNAEQIRQGQQKARDWLASRNP